MNKIWIILILLALGTGIALTQGWRETNEPKSMNQTPISINPDNNKQAPIEPISITFLAVGDIMLSRNVAQEIAKAKNTLLPFSRMAAILKSTDFNIANLESPFSGSAKYSASPTLVFNAPPQNIEGLKEYNFKLLSLANNHSLDQGLKGLLNTKAYIAQNGLWGAGVGENEAEAWEPAILEIKGLKIGMLATSYSSINDNGKTMLPYVARLQDTERFTEALKALRPKADLVIVSMHAGTEYTYKPNQLQKDFAHLAIDSGADIVIGHHPHWIQTIEKYNGKYIFYSLGNFIFDQEWSRQTKEGLTAKITVAKNELETLVEKIELTPVIIENYSTPRPATADEAQRILDNIGLKTNVF